MLRIQWSADTGRARWNDERILRRCTLVRSIGKLGPRISSSRVFVQCQIKVIVKAPMEAFPPLLYQIIQNTVIYDLCVSSCPRWVVLGAIHSQGILPRVRIRPAHSLSKNVLKGGKFRPRTSVGDLRKLVHRFFPLFSNSEQKNRFFKFLVRLFFRNWDEIFQNSTFPYGKTKKFAFLVWVPNKLEFSVRFFIF